jgi:LysR family transcriptional regulator of gallate degradation
MVDPFILNLRHLRAVSAIAQHGSISGASQTVNLSQPALTQGLAKLERQLGTTLFQRQSDGMIATSEGMTTGARAAAALEHLAAGARAAARGGSRGFARPELLMTATQLRAFLAVADTGSFVAAAGATGLSQPAIHRAVRDLEELCAVSLVERRGRGVALTPAGTKLARGARLARAEISALVADVAADPAGARLVIGAMPLCRALILPAAIARFTREQPAARLDIVEGSWRELVDPLRDGVLDFMVGALREAAPPECVQSPLMTDRLAVIARTGHPLTGMTTPTLDDLAAFPWIVGQPGTPLRQQWEALFPGQKPAAPIECGSVMVIRGVLIDSDFLTLLSPDQVALEVERGLLTQIGGRLDHSLRTIGVTTRERWHGSVAQMRFLAILSDVST